MVPCTININGRKIVYTEFHCARTTTRGVVSFERHTRKEIANVHDMVLADWSVRDRGGLWHITGVSGFDFKALVDFHGSL